MTLYSATATPLLSHRRSKGAIPTSAMEAFPSPVRNSGRPPKVCHGSLQERLVGASATICTTGERGRRKEGRRAARGVDSETVSVAEMGESRHHCQQEVGNRLALATAPTPQRQDGISCPTRLRARPTCRLVAARRPRRSFPLAAR